jgi:hypothetical protein
MKATLANGMQLEGSAEELLAFASAMDKGKGKAKRTFDTSTATKGDHTKIEPFVQSLGFPLPDSPAPFTGLFAKVIEAGADKAEASAFVSAVCAGFKKRRYFLSPNLAKSTFGARFVAPADYLPPEPEAKAEPKALPAPKEVKVPTSSLPPPVLIKK